MEEAIETTLNCYRICLETLNHCLETGGKHAAREHVEILLDCINICNLTADFMMRESVFHPRLCELCADICDTCAKSCDALPGDEMGRCSEACRACAKSCREMAA